MHNLKSNYDKFFDITNLFYLIGLTDSITSLPTVMLKLSDCQIVALAIIGETLGIGSENYFWGKLKSDHKQDFPDLIDRSNFSRRRKRVYPFIQELNQKVASQMNQGETDIWLIQCLSPYE